ncbi:MAG: undecaprenyldiphospho-muramoylpentapeptide beta-N-acetylglucosaminyltransferase [Thermodesulfovibrionales bacterium]
MKVIIAGGGTGGHVFPGIAIADEISRRDESAEVTFVGTEHGIERSIVPQEGYSIRFLRAEGIVGKSMIKKLRAGIKVTLSIFDSYKIINELKPEAIIGVGGYASFGMVLTGCLLSIPTMIMEQNSVPGLANKVLGRFVDAICVTYHESLSFFPKEKTYITGNPVRQGIIRGERDKAYELFSLDRNRFTILVFGGSAGATRINRAICDAFNYLTDIKDQIQFLHQTGRSDIEWVKESYRRWGFRGTVTPFIYEMAEAYAVSDLVISRAGATTLSEITAIGRPAILIPYPFAASGHQEENARKLTAAGAAKMILDDDLSGEVLSEEIKKTIGNDDLRKEMERTARSLGRPDAAGQIVDILISLCKRNPRLKIQDSKGVQNV